MLPTDLLALLWACRPAPVAPDASVTLRPACEASDSVPFAATSWPGAAAESHRHWGAGVAALDLEGDGDLDLVTAGPHEVRLFVQDRAGFTEGISVEGPWLRTVGASVADADEDGDLDVLITQWGAEDVWLRNDAGVLVAAATFPPAHSQSSAWGDLDGDGHLDLAVAGHGPVEGGEQVVVPGPGDPLALWRSDGAGGFFPWGKPVDPRINEAYTYVVGFTELDGDGLPDLMLANDYPVYRPTLGARQTGDGFVADLATAGLEVRAAGMGLGAADLNGDGWDDFLLPVWDRIVVLRSVAGVPPRWVQASEAMGLTLPEREEAWVGWGGEWPDLDNDGDLDALVAFGHLDAVAPLTASGGPSANAAVQRLVAFENTGEGFVDRSTAWGLDVSGVFRGFVVADLDRDGWLDVVLRDLSGPVHLLKGRCAENRSLTVRPEPLHRAVGAIITVWAQGHRQTVTVRAGGTSLASGGPPEAHFGLGPRDSVDRIEVLWPDGATSLVGPVPSNAVVTVGFPD